MTEERKRRLIRNRQQTFAVWRRKRRRGGKKRQVGKEEREPAFGWASPSPSAMGPHGSSPVCRRVYTQKDPNNAKNSAWQIHQETKQASLIKSWTFNRRECNIYPKRVSSTNTRLGDILKIRSLLPPQSVMTFYSWSPSCVVSSFLWEPSFGVHRAFPEQALPTG